MSATETLLEARAAGIDVRVEGCGLVLQAETPPPADLLARLVLHKQGIIRLLRRCCDGWSADAWREYFDERAGIAEFDGGLTRQEAEIQAFESCVVEWIKRTADGSPPGLCVACGGAAHAHDGIIPRGVEAFPQIGLHQRCWPSWYARRKPKAVAALKVMRIETPEFPNDFGKTGGA